MAALPRGTQSGTPGPRVLGILSGACAVDLWSCLSSVSLNIVSYGSTNELFQSRLINCVALMEIYRSRFFSIKAGIEEFMRIFQESALKKVHFYCFLESADRTNKSLVRPYRGIPLPFLSDAWVGLEDKFAQSGERLAAPVG